MVPYLLVDHDPLPGGVLSNRRLVRATEFQHDDGCYQGNQYQDEKQF